ncbi:MAG: metallophosphoesterase [Acidobacteriaceae bacterium]|nr:metallophosphoesterase [Acidobacteriaceae bacterium]
MKLLVFSDIHGDVAALEKLIDTEADRYFAAGDLVNWGRGLERMGPILSRKADRMYVLPGNHESEADIARLCDQFHLHNFHGNTLELGGYHIAGLGYSNPTPFDTPGEYSEAELSQRLSKFAGLSPLILICHCPPKDTPLDRIRDHIHAGSTAVRDFIEKEQPRYFFCGHVHEAAGAEGALGSTRCRNVGKKGYLLEI